MRGKKGKAEGKGVSYVPWLPPIFWAVQLRFLCQQSYCTLFLFLGSVVLIIRYVAVFLLGISSICFTKAFYFDSPLDAS